jgi:zona occludens toxin (predicted ATPase)
VSIFAYTGLPGSGKSYSVVEQQILPALKAGRLVVTNLPVKRDLICADLGIQPDMLREFPAEAVAAEPNKIFDAAPNGSVLVLDEVWRLFPAGLKTNQVPEAFKTVFAEHRHRVDVSGQSMQIVLVTQDLAQIAAFARQVVETTFRTVKLTSIGLSTRFRVDVFAGPKSGPNPNPDSALRQIPGRYRKEIYRYYVSHTQSESETEGADETAVDKRANILRRPLMLAAPLVIVGLVWFGIDRLWNVKQSFGPSRPPESAPAGGRSQTPQAAGRSGVIGVRAGVGAASGAAAKSSSPDIQVLMEVADRRDPKRGTAYLSVGARVVEISVGECRRVQRSLQCLYEGEYYDGVGWVEHGPQEPIGSWSVAPVGPLTAAKSPSLLSGGPGVQGVGPRPPGAAVRRDGRHNSS